MPRWAAPKATKVATSKERTRMMSRSAWLVVKRSCRASGSAKARSGSMPARANSGAASLRMRPLGSARMSFSLTCDTTLCSNNECPPLVDRLFDRMGGLPRGRPGLPDVPQMACKTSDFQPDGAACGEPQRNRTLAVAAVVEDEHQQFEHAVGLVERDLVMADRRHLVENKGG